MTPIEVINSNLGNINLNSFFSRRQGESQDSHLPHPFSRWGLLGETEWTRSNQESITKWAKGGRVRERQGSFWWWGQWQFLNDCRFAVTAEPDGLLKLSASKREWTIIVEIEGCGDENEINGVLRWNGIEIFTVEVN
jgi:hypothetical protein